MKVFVGVSVGPGDPELITVKAIRALESANVILVPSTEARTQGPGRAEEVIVAAAPHVEHKICRVPFSMSTSSADRLATRDTAADTTLAQFAEGAGVVAFASIGDVSVFSTFSYTAARVTEARDDVAVEVIPGITAMQTIAAVRREPLCLGDEVLALVPATAGAETLARVLDVADSVVVYKGGRRAADIVEVCRAAGKTPVIGTDLGLPEQCVSEADDVASRGYFTTIWAIPKGDRA